MRLGAQRLLPLCRSGPASTRFHPSRVPACSRPTPGSSVARPPALNRQWAVKSRPGSSRATGSASSPPARSWPASPTPRGPAAWRGRSTVSRVACATAQRASPADGFASPPSAGNVLGAAPHRGVSWQGKNRASSGRAKPRAVSRRRQFTGPSLNTLGLRCAACGRWPPQARETGNS